MKRFSHNFSFTIIEVLLVVFLIAIISTFSTSFYSRFIIQNDLANTEDSLIGSLRKAQIYSMIGRQNDNWGVNYTNHKITLFKGSAYGQDHSFDEIFNINPNINISGFNEINFNRITGIPNTSLNITISGLGNSRIITVNGQGVASRQ